MACNIGANDVANAMGTSVGSKALTFKQAIMIAAVAEFAGAFLVGGHVSDTIRKGMLDPSVFEAVPYHLVYGMISALLAAALWLHISSYLGWPVSTTHSIVGGVVGFGVIAGGMDVINWGKVGQVVLSWVVSPLMGGFVAFVVFTFISKAVFSKRTPLIYAKNLLPYMVFFVFVILTNAMVYKGLKNLHLNLSFDRALMISLAVGALAFVVTKYLATKIPYNSTWDLQKQFHETENVFKYLQILTAFYVAFAHGSNDVANAVGPLAAVVAILQDGQVHMKVIMPAWILGLGGGCIVLGLLVWGAKVMATIGEKITELTPSRGFAATFGAATVVLICSKMGLPISTTHTLVGSVIGVGLARGLPTLNLDIIKMIAISWISTIPFTAVIAMLCYKIFLIFLP
ncbi:MAG: inorganic phosphate transporter [Nitrospina sp.]|nr:inorganic phosphate transporter [Nitrospina sp.]MBT3511114.1 inorganic phosphate transporter [Nitrospina sp.]MBT3877046.1 inorganic phosphate transporter [Nitrospina sp.]MBT4048317.1 inorganic phosphate transporter [Nitrospina sp.]MBT4558238.1 inorganic phosphate transporter [Nitrospina sp.]